MNRKNIFQLLAFILVFCAIGRSYAVDESNHEIGFRANVVLSQGEPANDMLGAGIISRHKLNDDWWLGFELNFSSKFDFERPWKAVNLQQDNSQSTIDADASSNMISALIERRYQKENSNIVWLWNMGLGVNSVDVKDVTGPTAGGGTFDITTDAGTEAVLLGGVGFLHKFSENWSARYEIALEYRFADWKVRDRVSGNTGTVENYHTVGPRIGVSYTF